ncbi:hypothetical protein OG897_24190 [Streptomyces sp. NBC_00237]|uniref:hypothetical protein n=1 Tax=Streptomyces sp. NBC_00237 TaxID=2975687 RepID=UPI00225AECA5|nr:hypothetical protein [Streptomyces sp. NBC_00237]MCX5204542.1 hypothetical protein [Streptomyces sp. NBC_00237]
MPRTPRTPTRRTAVLAAVAATSLLATGAVLLGTNAEDPDAPRPVTTQEAERLAVARFLAYESSPARITATIDDGADSVIVKGVIDYRTHRAVGTYTAGRPAQRGLIAWDTTGLSVSLHKPPADDTAAQVTRVAAQLPARAWTPRGYAQDPLDTALKVLMALGVNRPDNPQLLAQSGTRRLGERTLGGRSHTLFSGPRPQGRKAPQAATSPVTYWVDASGRLGRMELRTGGLPRPVLVDFLGTEPQVRIPDKPWRRR